MMKSIFAALLLLPATALAQSTPLPSADDIIVNGRKEADRKAAEAYVAEISVRSESQLARYHQPVCPLLIGMPKPFSTIVEKRIADDAAAAGIKVAKKAKCSPNLIVVIAESGADLVRDIRIHRPGWIEGLVPAEVDALIAPAPARAWSVTSLRNEDGVGLYTPPNGNDPGLGGMASLNVMSASIIKQPIRQDMEASFVVIDKAATMGLTLRQVADYAAMRGLARTRPPSDRGGAIGTILTVLDQPQGRARELTAADAAYLKALYRGDGTAAGVTERNSIARRISRGK